MKLIITGIILILLIFNNTVYGDYDPTPYEKRYIAPEQGEADWHNPYAEPHEYGGIFHREGENCPQGYYNLLKIWDKYGEFYNAGYINHIILEDMDWFIFSQKKGTYVPKEIEAIVDKYFLRKHRKYFYKHGGLKRYVLKSVFD